MVQSRSASTAIKKESRAVANSPAQKSLKPGTKDQEKQPSAEEFNKDKKESPEARMVGTGAAPAAGSGAPQSVSASAAKGAASRPQKGTKPQSKDPGQNVKDKALQPDEVPEEKKKGDKGKQKRPMVASGGGSAGGAGEEQSAAARGAAMVEEIKKKLPNVKKELKKVSANVCGQADAKAGVLAENEKTHDNATTKQAQTDAAVVPPSGEGQAQSNAGQVDKLDDKTAPKPSEAEAKSELQKELDKSVPKTMGDLSDFKKKSKAKTIGEKVAGEVTKEVKAVDETYNEINKTPPPTPSTKQIQPLPEIEVAPPTPELDLGKGAVPGLDKSHTEFQAFDEGSDDVLKQEGITDKELDMVDSGDLLQARNERKGIKKSVKEEPGKIKQYALGQQEGVKKDLKQEERQVRNTMEGKRKEKLRDTQQKQKGTKSAIEKKRAEVTKHIKGIYELAQKKIKGKLESLEKESMARFDREQKRFSVEFENEVNRDIGAWKKKRYSGAFGWFKKGKDWLLGIDDFPEVKAAFKKAKDNYVRKIDGLIAQITKDNQKAINDCKKELKQARKDIKKFVSGLDPDVQKAGEAAMRDMKKKLDELDGFIDKKKEELSKKLCDKKEEAIQKIDKKIEEMKEAMSGALSKLVGFLVNAMLKFFKWVLGKFGMDQGALMKVIDKGIRTLKQIVLHPIDFIMNLVRGVGQGIKNFGANIKKHLISGVIGWLTGSLGGIGITLPEKWDIKGVLYLLMQILGLTWDRIRAKLVKHIGEEKVAMAEKSVDIVKRLISEGPMALWEMIKEKAAEIKETVMTGIRNWVVTNIVKQGIIALASFLSPAGAIVQAIKTIYNAVMFLIDNWDRIVTFVKTVFGAISDIAFGKLGAVAAAVERGIAMIIPMILDFMAKLLNLGGITKAVKNVIKKVRKPIDKVVNRLIKFVTGKVKKLFGAGKKVVKKGVAAAKKGATKLKNFFFPKHKFQTDDGAHTLMVNGKKSKPEMLIASTPTPIKTFLANWERKQGSSLSKDKKKKIKEARSLIDGKISTLMKQLDAAQKKSNTPPSKIKSLQKQLLQEEVKLSGIVKSILGSTGKLKGVKDKYLLEGLTGTYGSMPKPKYDDLTADHQPQAAILQEAAKMPFFKKGAKGKKMRDHASGRANGGFAINLHKYRHMAGRTYGGKGGATKDQFLAKVDTKIANETDNQKKRNAVVNLIKSDLKKDVGAMRTVVTKKENWRDIYQGSYKDDKGNLLSEKAKDKLVKETKAQILSGQSKVEAQDLESLKG